MPLYEYCCRDCHGKFETLRGISKADYPIQCPHCESMATRRGLSLFAAFSRGEGDSSKAIAGGGGGCASCGGGSCRSCSH